MRENRITPHGWDSRRNERSAADKVAPPSPDMNARISIGADHRARVRRGQWPSVAWDYAMAAGGLVAGTELARLLHRGKRSHHGAVEHPLAAQIGPLNNRLPPAKLIWELCLQAAEGGGCFGLGFLRRELHQKAAGGVAAGFRRGARRRRRRCRRGARGPRRRRSRRRTCVLCLRVERKRTARASAHGLGVPIPAIGTDSDSAHLLWLVRGSAG